MNLIPDAPCFYSGYCWQALWHLCLSQAVFKCALKRHTIHNTELLKLINGSGSSVEGLVLCGLVVRTTLTYRGQRGKCWRSWRMTKMQKILAGMNELNERVQNAKAERRKLSGIAAIWIEGKGEECSSATTTGTGDRRIFVKVPASAARRRERQVERMGSSFSQLIWTVFGGALADICEHVEGHCNDSATILDPALTSLRFDAGLARNFSTELYVVLIMLTRGRAQLLVLEEAEPEGLEAYRLLLRRYQPVSTVTTVSKLVDLLATIFSGDLTDSLTDFERRVTSWEHDANCQIWSKSELSWKVWRKVVFEIICCVDQHCWHDRMDETCERDRKRRISTKKHTACTDEFVGDGQPRSKVPRQTVHGVQFTVTWREIVERKLNTCKTTK